ncbi:acyl-CoA thioesterase [Zavarzinia compransoris]|uniref:Acyl-CoA thioesterase n=2 Tax=Zavarzinia compransoris TaxID=1264899 RepID=A0A317EAH2_9PROT|nr:acyl-CoA thioesterase [Zavarzinia compransoris]PWR24117.1 acyl-CoA thioesterase [Zavarzinia compransoris]
MATDDSVHPEARGLEVVIRTAPMPADANGNGDIFGGWILSHMDIAAGVLAAKRAQGRVATVAIDAMTFLKPVYIGDLLSIYGEVVGVGRTSIKVRLETWVERQRRRDGSLTARQSMRVTEGTFVMVAIDEEGRPRVVPEA